MKDEIAAAVVFITKLVRKAGLSKDQSEKFQNNLTTTLLERFKDHWYETVPSRGQAYRCIRINDTEGVDPVLQEAAIKSGLRIQDLGLPSELTLWVDPTEVSCRLGENRGAFCTVALFYDGSSENKAKTVNVDEILALHLERKQAEHAKFLKATSTRSRRKDSSSRCSPPVPSGYGMGNPPYCPGGAYQNIGWEDPGNGYPSSDRFYGANCNFEVEIDNGSQNAPNQVTWGNWSHHGEQQRVSPDHNSHSSDHLHFNNSTRKVRMATGGSHLGKPSSFSSHSGNKFRWVKPADAAQA